MYIAIEIGMAWATLNYRLNWFFTRSRQQYLFSSSDANIWYLYNLSQVCNNQTNKLPSLGPRPSSIMVQAKSCLATFSVGLGFILVILGVVVKYSLFPTLLESQIYDNLDLRNGTEAFDAFVSKSDAQKNQSKSFFYCSLRTFFFLIWA